MHLKQESCDFNDKQAELLDCLIEVKEIIKQLKNVPTLSVPESLQILKLFQNNETLIHKLDSETIYTLMGTKLTDCTRHLDRLKQRISDATSKILVTGDLNSGKSTFINTLLRENLLPTDQQPCTMSFCEIVSKSRNHGQSAVHLIADVKKYDPKKPSTFTAHSLEELDSMVTDETAKEWIRIYSNDSENILSNDVILIDAPGLNTDSLKTMSVFATQDDIDIVVFVVNAANHLTQSATDFLQAAGKEKSLIFIVVNKFDEIKNKEKCKRIISQQISEVLPLTFAEQHDLLHYVSAKDQLGLLESNQFLDEFLELESSLHTFLVEKRVKSKLWPAQTWLMNLLQDISAICELNSEIMQTEYENSLEELKKCTPVYEKMHRIQEKFMSDLERIASENTREIGRLTELELKEFVSAIPFMIDDIQWHGILFVFSYIDEVVSHVLTQTENQMSDCNRTVKDQVTGSIHQLYSLASCNVSEIFNKTPDIQSVTNQLEFRPPVSKLSIRRLALFKPGWKSIITVSVAAFGSTKLASVAYASLKFLHLISFKSTVLILVCSTTFLAMSNIRNVVKANLKQSIMQHFDESNLPSKCSAYYSELASRTLKIPFWDLQKQFHQALHNQEELRFAKEQKKLAAYSALEYFRNMNETTLRLRGSLSKFKE